MNRKICIRKPRIILTPLELVLIEKIIRNISTAIQGLKMTIVFLLSCLAGLRPMEISKLRLSDFVRDPKTGLLIRDEKNRAVLHLPANMSSEK